VHQVDFSLHDFKYLLESTCQKNFDSITSFCFTFFKNFSSEYFIWLSICG